MANKEPHNLNFTPEVWAAIEAGAHAKHMSKSEYIAWMQSEQDNPDIGETTEEKSSCA